MEHNQFIQLVENAINAFEKQGHFSRSQGMYNKCYYSNNGLCCIVGLMMPDETTRIAADNFSETSILSLYGSDFDWAKQFNHQQIDLLSDLQTAHDTELSIDTALVEMRHYLLRYGVNHK